MGIVTSCLSEADESVVDQKDATKSNENHKKPSLYSFPPRRDECVQKESIFYDARQSLTQSMMITDYVPASVPSFVPRGSVIMEEPETLLQSSNRDLSSKRRQTIVVKHDLQDPSLKVEQRGYPGNLTEEELEAALDFRQALKTDQDKRDIVECFVPLGIEDEPYALCRLLRGRNFNVEDTLVMVGENVAAWKEFKRHDFYPTIEQAVGCPGSVLLTQYPYLFHGNAKNGCPLNYQMVGTMKAEGLECITELDRLANYVMHSIMYQFTETVKIAQKEHPNRLARTECIAIIDLKGLDSSQLNKKALGALKNISTATSCFPEMLNRMIVLNASYAFSFFWTMIKAFLEAKTVSKIEIYTNEKKGKERLLELVDKKELLSNYGGSGASFESLAQTFGSKSGAKRQASKLLTMNGSVQTVVTLEKNEKATISVYTRSEGEVSLLRNKSVTKTIELTKPKGEPVSPFCTEISTKEAGPGKVNVSASPTGESTSYDYLLAYVEVFPTSG